MSTDGDAASDDQASELDAEFSPNKKQGCWPAESLLHLLAEDTVDDDEESDGEEILELADNVDEND